MTLWTKKYSRYGLLNQTIKLLDLLLEEITEKNLFDLNKYGLSKEIIKDVFRPTFHLSLNIFIERLVRVNNFKNSIHKKNYLKTNYPLYENSINYFLDCYYNVELNEKLISDLSNILNKENPEEYKIKEKEISIKKNFFFSDSKFYLRIFESYLNRAKNRIFENLFITNRRRIVYDGTMWMSPLLKNCIKFNNNNELIYKKNNDLRTIIYKKLENFFYNKSEINQIINIIDDKKYSQISKLFSKWIVSSIPLSLFEGFDKNYKYYYNFFANKDLEEIHATTELLFNDKFKIFVSIFKNKNIPIIVHDHGVCNFSKYFDDNENHRYTKMMPLLKFSDYYFAWGKSKKIDRWQNVEKKFETKIFNFGSIYLNSLKTNNKIINLEKRPLKIFYASAPFKKYMAILDEITPEESLIHKKKISNFIERIINNFDVEFVYKNFHSTLNQYESDPIVNYLYKYILNGKIKLTMEKPIKIMSQFDIILLDVLSTTFAETISMKLPSLIFSNKFDYSILCKDGKKINDDLEKNKILFYDEGAAFNCFQLLIKGYKNYFNINSKIFLKYQESIAYPQELKILKKNLDKVRLEDFNREKKP